MSEASNEQRQLAAELLEELECLDDVGELSLLMILDALACGGLALVRSRDMEASEAFFDSLPST